MLGIVPAAGRGSRIQPLGFSKELLPVGSRVAGGDERPRAVGEYLVERMVIGGADRICFVISPGKYDIMEYFGAECASVSIAYVIQPQPLGLCDAVFRAVPIMQPDELILVGLPDTVWFPDDGLKALPEHCLSFLLFPVDHPEAFDAVALDRDGRVVEIQVKQSQPSTNWIWGAFAMPGAIFRDLHTLWHQRNRQDEYIGTLVNAYLDAGGTAFGVKAGTSYADVGTINGYRAASHLISEQTTRSVTEHREGDRWRPAC